MMKSARNLAMQVAVQFRGNQEVVAHATISFSEKSMADWVYVDLVKLW